MSNLNVWAILVAAVSAFMLGGPWYSSALFGKLWKQESGQTQPGSGHPAKVFGVAFLFSLIAATGFAAWLGPEPPLKFAVTQGLIVGGCFVATSFGINYQFANRSALMWLIDAAYHIAQFVIFGVVLGLWH